MIQNLTSWGLRISIISFAFLHFFTIFWEVEFLLLCLKISGLSLIIFSIGYFTIKKFKLPLTIFIVGLIILFLSGHPLLDGIFHGVILMRNMVGLLMVVPLISWVLREEPYIEDVMSLFRRFIDTSKRFYASLVIFTQIIAYFLLFGSIQMMYQFVQIILKDQSSELWENFKGTALLRGFALSTMWVISIPSFVFAVDALGASLWIAILQGLGMAIVGTLMAVIYISLKEKRLNVSFTSVIQDNLEKLTENASPKAVQKRKVVEFFILFITLFGTIFLIHAVFHVNLLITIPIVIICWIITFYIVKRRGHKLGNIGKTFVMNDVLKNSYQLNIMLTVGVLIYGLRQTDFANIVVNGFHTVENYIPVINPLFLLPFIVIILGLVGLGPLTVMVLVAGILSSLNLPYPPELIVLSVTSGSVISILISPVILPVIALSASNGLSMFTNGMKFNWKFSILFYIVVQIYLQTMVHFWHF